ncbi:MULTISPECIES: ArdC-like ssDNA-binding domain-containing protein [Vagococcus]|uniref:Uncharacterized protein n=1 Tax=Vagococcus fluvialis bH819 TaxID=1255619 RepID=A0A1X6WS23_9ENTE|nr:MULTISPECIES: ArdC-like ssDNA-binding domain-containing protein [Vagococcus]SLM87067.1 hypothetical protein FM121_13295 [Vagococcus fluvialis bH819]HCM90587.1 hypothetical protein [Vagococcus sp.]
MAKKTFTSKTTEQKQKELDDLLDRSLSRIKSYKDSPEDLKEFMDFMSKIHKYSPTNLSLIQEQFEGATAVASYKDWKDKGFQVQRGEKGIEMYVYTPVKTFKNADGDIKMISKATPQEKAKISSGEYKVSSKPHFSKGNVFDVSQTNATKEDLPKMFPNQVWNFDIDGESSLKELSVAVGGLSDKLGIDIKDMKDSSLGELGSARGAYIQYIDGKEEISLNSRNSSSQNVATAIHELAHKKLHNLDRLDNMGDKYNNSKVSAKAIKEFEAEMTSYIVCKNYGMDTSEKAIPYIAKWTNNAQEIDPKLMKDILGDIKATVNEFTQSMDETILEMRKNESIEQKQEVNYSKIIESLNDLVIYDVDESDGTIFENRIGDAIDGVGLTFGDKDDFINIININVDRSQLTGLKSFEDYSKKVNLAELVEAKETIISPDQLPDGIYMFGYDGLGYELTYSTNAKDAIDQAVEVDALLSVGSDLSDDEDEIVRYFDYSEVTKEFGIDDEATEKGIAGSLTAKPEIEFYDRLAEMNKLENILSQLTEGEQEIFFQRAKMSIQEYNNRYAEMSNHEEMSKYYSMLQEQSLPLDSTDKATKLFKENVLEIEGSSSNFSADGKIKVENIEHLKREIEINSLFSKPQTQKNPSESLFDNVKRANEEQFKNIMAELSLVEQDLFMKKNGQAVESLDNYYRELSNNDKAIEYKEFAESMPDESIAKVNQLFFENVYQGTGASPEGMIHIDGVSDLKNNYDNEVIIQKEAEPATYNYNVSAKQAIEKDINRGDSKQEHFRNIMIELTPQEQDLFMKKNAEAIESLNNFYSDSSKHYESKAYDELAKTMPEESVSKVKQIFKENIYDSTGMGKENDIHIDNVPDLKKQYDKDQILLSEFGSSKSDQSTYEYNYNVNGEAEVKNSTIITNEVDSLSNTPTAIKDVVINESVYRLSENMSNYYDIDSWSKDLTDQLEMTDFGKLETVMPAEQFYNTHFEEIEETLDHVETNSGLNIRDGLTENYKSEASLMAYKVNVIALQSDLKVNDFAIPKVKNEPVDEAKQTIQSTGYEMD